MVIHACPLTDHVISWFTPWPCSLLQLFVPGSLIASLLHVTQVSFWVTVPGYHILSVVTRRKGSSAEVVYNRHFPNFLKCTQIVQKRGWQWNCLASFKQIPILSPDVGAMRVVLANIDSTVLNSMVALQPCSRLLIKQSCLCMLTAMFRALLIHSTPLSIQGPAQSFMCV